MSALDKHVEDWSLTLAADVSLDVSVNASTHVALRTSCGEDILLSLEDCGDHLSIDLSVLTADSERRMDAFTLSNGRSSDRIHGMLLVAMVPR